MAEHTISMRDEGWKEIGGARIRGPLASRLVVSADGALKGAVLEDHRAPLELVAPASQTQSPALFGSAPTLTSSIPGGVLVPVARRRKGPYRRSYENAYVRADVTTHPFLPTLMIGFKSYALLTLAPEELEAVRRAVSRHFLAEESDVRISRFGVAVDLLRIGFVPPRESEILTRARLVDDTGDPRLASPTLGSPSGGVMFALYDHTALRSPEEDWLSDRPRPRHAPPKGLRVWRTEVTYHRPAIRKLGLDKGGVRRASVIETIPDLADHTTELVSATLGGEDPWVTVIHNPSGSMSPAIPEAPWWGPVREAFLEGGSVGIAVPSMLPTSGGNGKPGRSPLLGRLATLLSLNRR